MNNRARNTAQYTKKNTFFLNSINNSKLIDQFLDLGLYMGRQKLLLKNSV